MTISKKIIIGSLTLIATLGLIACEEKMNAESAGKSIDEATVKTVDAVKDASDTASEKTVNIGNAIADSAITAKVKAVILAEENLNVLDISVDTKDNVTTLSGSVDSQINSDRAEEITMAVDGVDRVDNQLMVAAVK